MMRKNIVILFLAGVLGFAAARVLRREAGTADRPAASGGEPAGLRVADYDARIEALAEVEPALVLYREAAALPLPGHDALTALAVGADDRIYAGVGDTVLVLDAQGAVLRRIAAGGPVSCLAVDADGRLYAGLGDTVHALAPDGSPAAVFRDLPPRAIITSLAAAGDAVFVADAQSRTVMRFTPDGALEQANDGRQGRPDAAGFIIPSPRFDITPGQGGTLWVVNPGRLRLEEYTHHAERIRAWDERPGMRIEAFCGCCNPSHIARLADGTIVTGEKGLPRVKLYTPRGVFLGVVAPPGLFDGPDAIADLAVDSRDRILVADATRRQVRVFERREDPP